MATVPRTTGRKIMGVFRRTSYQARMARALILAGMVLALAGFGGDEGMTAFSPLGLSGTAQMWQDMEYLMREQSGWRGERYRLLVDLLHRVETLYPSDGPAGDGVVLPLAVPATAARPKMLNTGAGSGLLLVERAAFEQRHSVLMVEDRDGDGAWDEVKDQPFQVVSPADGVALGGFSVAAQGERGHCLYVYQPATRTLWRLTSLAGGVTVRPGQILRAGQLVGYLATGDGAAAVRRLDIHAFKLDAYDLRAVVAPDILNNCPSVEEAR